MRAFNKKKRNGAKVGFKSYTHLEIGFENCEYLLIPIKCIDIIMDGDFIKKIQIKNFKNVLVDKWIYDNLEQRFKRLTKNSNDIASVNLLIESKKDMFNYYNNSKYNKEVKIHNYLVINPHGWRCDNLLQETVYDEELDILVFEWIVDDRIKINYDGVQHYEKCTVEIPKEYADIIDRLDKNCWIVNEL